MSNRFQPRLPNKESRERHEVLVALGYTPSHYSAGHVVYTHAQAPPFHLACTPRRFGHASKGFIAELKRRHPERFPTQRSSRPRYRPSRAADARRAEARRKARLTEAERQVAARPTYQPSPEDMLARQITRPTCTGCGRVWLSRDVDPETHPCPACGGEHAIPINWEVAA